MNFIFRFISLMFLKTALDDLSLKRDSAAALLIKLAGLPVSTVKLIIELKHLTSTSRLLGLSSDLEFLLFRLPRLFVV